MKDSAEQRGPGGTSESGVSYVISVIAAGVTAVDDSTVAAAASSCHRLDGQGSATICFCYRCRGCYSARYSCCYCYVVQSLYASNKPASATPPRAPLQIATQFGLFGAAMAS
jgi:hypothetical protein